MPAAPTCLHLASRGQFVSGRAGDAGAMPPRSLSLRASPACSICRAQGQRRRCRLTTARAPPRLQLRRPRAPPLAAWRGGGRGGRRREENGGDMAGGRASATARARYFYSAVNPIHSHDDGGGHFAS